MGGSALLRHLHSESDELTDVRERLERAIADEPPALATDPGIIRSGYDGELDELRNLSQHSKQIIAAMEERERKRTGIGSLKIRFNQIFGYYMEISKPNLHLAPADYERKQTLVNAERFTSPELKEYERKILAADERILEIERQLFVEIRSSIAAQAACVYDAPLERSRSSTCSRRLPSWPPTAATRAPSSTQPASCSLSAAVIRSLKNFFASAASASFLTICASTRADSSFCLSPARTWAASPRIFGRLR